MENTTTYHLTSLQQVNYLAPASTVLLCFFKLFACLIARSQKH